MTAALLAVAALGLTACGESGAGELAGNDSGYVAGAGTTTFVAPADRKPAPPLAGPTLDGGTYDLADHLGETVVINVWASWCPPCRAEMPGLQRIATEYADQGVSFVGIDTRDTDAAARAFLENVGVTYPNLIDPDGELLLPFRDTLPPQAIPSTLIVDADGKVAARVIGPVTEVRLRELLDEVLAS
jgi:thiol-disulfide isomerase/thioredoxin